MSRKKKAFLTILAHFGIVALLAALCVWGCPFHHLTGLPCPGCGATRAFLAFFRGDLAAAFGYHALFFLLPPLLFIAFHRDCAPLQKRRRIIDPFLISGAVLLFVYNGFRIASVGFC